MFHFRNGRAAAPNCGSNLYFRTGALLEERS